MFLKSARHLAPVLILMTFILAPSAGISGQANPAPITTESLLSTLQTEQHNPADSVMRTPASAPFRVIRIEDAPQTRDTRSVAQPVAHENLGWSVDIDGNTYIASGPQNWRQPTNNLRRCVYIHEKVNLNWPLNSTFCAEDQPPLYTGFGRSVAVDGDFAMIGADQFCGENCLHNGQGLVFVLRRTQGQWQLYQQLQAPDPAFGDAFGFSVALHGDFAIVGAPFKSISGVQYGGKLYLYRLTTNGWALEFSIFGTEPLMNVGLSVDMGANGIAAAGVPGGRVGNILAGYAAVMRRNSGGWTLDDALAASDPQAQAVFGHTVALHNDTLLVGAPQQTMGAEKSGVAYIFERNGIQWQQTARLIPSDPSFFGLFGYAGSLNETVAVIGSPNSLDPGISQITGGAYIFRKVGGVWQQELKFIAPDPAPSDNFGSALAATDTVIIVGAPGTDRNGLVNTGDIQLVDLLNYGIGPGVEWIIYSNPSFEDPISGSNPREAAGWVRFGNSNDRRVCNNVRKTKALDGNCAYQFRGLEGQRGGIKRRPGPNDKMDGNDTIQLSVWSETRNLTGTILIVFKINYLGGQSDKLSLVIPEGTTSGYQRFSSNSLILKDQIQGTVLKVVSRIRTGRVRMDTMSVRWIDSDTAAASLQPLEPLPLPVAPAGS